jgi:four helix bundle protein
VPGDDYGSRADVLEERLVNFAVAIIRLTGRLPRTSPGKHVAAQLLRSGTSPAPNYGEARSGESRADFAHKLAIVLKELNETRIWLSIIERSNLLDSSALAGAIEENQQLCRIVGASLRTAKGRAANPASSGNK